MEPETDFWSACIGQTIVIDLASPFVVIGTLERAGPTFLTIVEADVHDLRDSKTTRDLYVLKSKQLGLRCNRKSVCVNRSEVVSFSRLDDVIE